MSTQFENVKLVGTHFRDQLAKDIVAAMSKTNLVKLLREPDNKYDPNAIQVLSLRGVHLGYIEAGQAIWIADQMDEDLHVDWQGEVTEFSVGTRVTYPILTVSRFVAEEPVGSANFSLHSQDEGGTK